MDKTLIERLPEQIEIKASRAAEGCLAHVEYILGPVSTKPLETGEDDERSILRHNLYAVIGHEFLDYADRISEQHATIEAQASQIASLTAALQDVFNPLRKLERDAKAQGRQLNSMAYSIANDLHFVQSIAAEALSPAPTVEAGKLCPDTLEAAAKICEEQQQIFASPQYATGQPFSSFGERFACGKCAEEIRQLKDTNHD